ncbi:MAG: hypothetical protein V2J24_14825, partial [Pseudomonadales bacterium]|nr:hypothetical protein [Pseudomonadales bacterium]
MRSCFRQCLATLLLVLLATAAAAMGDALQAVHADIAADHPSVVHVDGAALAALPPAEVLLFDARDVEEYGVS